MYANARVFAPSDRKLVQVQQAPWESTLTHIFMYSITLNPSRIRPGAARSMPNPWSETGWLFLTGKGEDIENFAASSGL